jgi:hypothetical protein
MTDAGKTFDLRVGLILFLSLAACTPRQPAAPERGKGIPIAEQSCADRNKAEQTIEAERAKEDNAFFTLAISGTGDPVAEAKRALAAGDARFLGYSMLIPGIAPAAYGVECRPDLRLLRRAPIRALFAGSDVIGSPAAAEAERRAGENFARFGAAYNATLLADSLYAYRDICRAAPVGYRPEMSAPPPMPVSAWGFRDLTPTDHPSDLGEAARRGSLESLKKLIKDHPEAVNFDDMFAMTPLAWAITYRRDAHIAVLLAAGASPIGEPCGHITETTAPIQIARSMRWRSLITTMLPRLGRDDRAKLVDRATPDPARRADFSDLRKPLARQPVAMLLDIGPDGRTRHCTITTSSGEEGVDRQICAAFVKRRRWLPARNEFGDPVASQRDDRILF